MQRKIYRILVLLCVVFASSQLAAQVSLTVGDPRMGWRTDQGTIDEATFVLRPQGIYTAVDMYLTFSAEGLFYSNFDTLEVVLNFELPNGSIAIDSWLWIDDVIVKAAILDRWTASGIYEEIVGRRQDPSILFKEGNNKYQLRIFPMAGDRSRKVKISYLVPVEWTSNQVVTPLPYAILQTSRSEVDNIAVRIADSQEWGEPLLSNSSDHAFVKATDGFWETKIDANTRAQQASIAHTSPMEDGLYVSYYPEASGGYYQLALLPEKVFGVEEIAPKRVMILLENLPENSSISQQELLNQVEQQLLSTLSPNSYFNIIRSSLEVEPLEPNWIPGTPDAIRAAFDALRNQTISGYSNLPAMLAAAIHYIQDSEKGGEIMLIANSSEVGAIQTSNELIADIQATMGSTLIPIHICDYQRQNFRYYSNNNRSFRGNEYFYTNISRITAGSYVSWLDCCTNLAQSLQRAFDSVTALRGTFDLYTRLENGFCYNRYHPNTIGDVINYNRPIFQVGKYEGTFPFQVEIVGSLEGNLLAASRTVAANELNLVDTLAKQAWTGNYIQALEGLERSNDLISQIIDVSIQERVLSRYTAFIALEPRLGGEPCLECVGEDETVTVQVDDVSLQNILKISVTPNPFHDRARIVVELSQAADLKDYTFAIYNLVGQQIHVFSDIPDQVTDRLELTWEAGDEVATGVYFLVVQSPQGRQSIKLVKY